MKGKGITFKILVAMVLGIVTGLILNPMAETVIVKDYVVGFGLVLLGSIFVALIKMMVVPLVFVSLTNGAAQIGDIKKLGRIGGKTLGFYLLTTAIAITIAIILASIFLPMSVDPMDVSSYTFEAKESPAFVSVLIGMIPTNPIDSMAKGNMLQIIIFALITGTALSMLGDKVNGIKKLLEESNEVILKMVMLIMKFAPIGVFALIAKTITQLGFDAILDLGAYMLVVVAALFVHALFTYQGMLYAITKLNPIQFFKNFAPAMMVAFSTSSSSATLPVTIDTVTERLGVDRKLASFTLPLGATINMDGTAIMQGVATVFIAILYGVDLSLGDFITVIVTATLASIGTAGVPGVGLIMLSMVLTQVGLPVEAIGLILGIDRILDMTRTVVNITGDAVCTLIVAKTENEFDEAVYYNNNSQSTVSQEVAS
ncbi:MULTISPECIES: dicarboxylate/amino acid:cation symporter [unclassified Fusibacter]|uniref:dicarboxylate/amino acid:cation symporter n=1 Tax=unclassified Fusibacter TaxID=2624464 RepID=UPI0010118833|nr:MULTISPECIES: dicarboxylate/amino acid:cation symporter [unclassified Fusibacter]MCK8058632.1 dicarboxylate/amino acid:cation symporter [Fusibacter sp. A2]NPE21707.1 dicarboxylate/amino acid:cation symporter [Fusibacter sp. A1]RXV61282.1 dicarboxylate/amino acid:cation symporter [Fusibacter sp. A1]